MRYVGIFALKAYLLADGRDEALADKARLMTRQAEQDMAKVNQFSEKNSVDQYEINMASRWSMIESLAGDKQRGLALADRAIRLARQSERDQQKGLTGRDISTHTSSVPYFLWNLKCCNTLFFLWMIFLKIFFKFYNFILFTVIHA